MYNVSMISKNRLILILGLWVAFVALLGGFPSPYEEIIYVASGLTISTLSFLLARHKRIYRRPTVKKPRGAEVYMEAAPVPEHDAESHLLGGTDFAAEEAAAEAVAAQTQSAEMATDETVDDTLDDSLAADTTQTTETTETVEASATETPNRQQLT
jgi:hypothetical protein